jgi:hypothetical protein
MFDIDDEIILNNDKRKNLKAKIVAIYSNSTIMIVSEYGLELCSIEHLYSKKSERLKKINDIIN